MCVGGGGEGGSVEEREDQNTFSTPISKLKIQILTVLRTFVYSLRLEE